MGWTSNRGALSSAGALLGGAGTLQGRYTRVVTGAAMVPVVIISASMVLLTISHNRTQVHSQLSASARHVEARLETVEQLLVAGATSLASSQPVRGLLADLAHPGAPSLHQDVASDLLHRYQEEHWGMTHHVFLTDPRGHVVLSPPHGTSTKAHLGEDISESPFFAAALEAPVVTDFFGFVESTHYHQLTMAPVRGEDGTTNGVVVLENVIDFVTGEARETELGDLSVALYTLDGQRVVQDKGDRSEVRSELAVEAAGRAEGLVGVFEDAEGADRLGAFHRNGDRPWVVGVDIDAGAVFHAAQKLVLWAAIIAVLVAFALVLFSKRQASRLAEPLEVMARVANEFADGHLSTRAAGSGDREIDTLAESLNRAISNTRGGLDRIGSAISAIAGDGHDSGRSILRDSARIDERLRRVSLSVEEMSATSHDIAHSAAVMDQAATEHSQAAADAEERFAELEEIVHTIDEISGAIRDIAEQTNLLSLNATIEAARSGEAGRGFAVVASEVKNLAGQTADLSLQIAENLQGVTSRSLAAAEAVRGIRSAMSAMRESTVSIAAAAEEQSATTREISQQVAETSTYHHDNHKLLAGTAEQLRGHLSDGGRRRSAAG